MSQSGFDVMQQHDKDAPVTWEAYEGLRDHLTGMITKSADAIATNVQAVQLKVDATEVVVTTMQQLLTTIHMSLQQMTTSFTGIQAAIVQRQHEDDGSIHGDNADLRGNHGRGIGLQGPGHQPQFGLGAWRVPVQEDDG